MDCKIFQALISSKLTKNKTPLSLNHIARSRFIYLSVPLTIINLLAFYLAISFLKNNEISDWRQKNTQAQIDISRNFTQYSMESVIDDLHFLSISHPVQRMICSDTQRSEMDEVINCSISRSIYYSITKKDELPVSSFNSISD